MIVWLYVDARDPSRNNPPRVRGNVVRACLLPIDLGSGAFATHALVPADLPDSDPLVQRLVALRDAGQDATIPWPFKTTRIVDGPDGPEEVIDELCPANRRVEL